MNLPSEAICPKGGLHRWTDSADFHDAVVEVCEQCSVRAIWRKDERGRMDNRKYARAHLRSFAQPHGPTAKAFAMAHGEEAWKRAVADRPNRLPVDWELAGEDARAYLRELKKEKTAV